MRARAGRLLLALGVLVTGAACTDEKSPGAPGSTTAAMSQAANVFCDSWNTALLTGDDSALIDALTDVPVELEEHAATLREGHGDGPQSEEDAAAIAEVLDWTELHCPRGGSEAIQRRVAPPAGTTFDDLKLCGTIGLPPTPPDDQRGMVLYGRGDDPYRGPMLGLLWDPAGDGDHAGDDRGRPVTVRGQPGVAAAITVFQQVIPSGLGTVIAWTEGNRDFGLYGRQWPGGADDLVSIANRLEESDGRFPLPNDALPAGYRQVVSGDPSVASLSIAQSGLYTVHYQGDDFGSLTVKGLQMTAEEFEAFRFFTVDIERSQVAGHDAFVGNAWSDDGPAVVTWRESDGLVVRIVGTGAPLAIAQRVADESRELTSEEWAALVEAESQCPERRPPGLPPRPPGESPGTTALD